jgi:hypothetical protein
LGGYPNAGPRDSSVGIVVGSSGKGGAHLWGQRWASQRGSRKEVHGLSWRCLGLSHPPCVARLPTPQPGPRAPTPFPRLRRASGHQPPTRLLPLVPRLQLSQLTQKIRYSSACRTWPTLPAPFSPIRFLLLLPPHTPPFPILLTVEHLMLLLAPFCDPGDVTPRAPTTLAEFCFCFYFSLLALLSSD